MAYNKVTQKDEDEALTLVDLITPIPGEKRTIEKCTQCGQLYGRRFIPFGTGRGASFGMCICQCVSANIRSLTVLEVAP